MTELSLQVIAVCQVLLALVMLVATIILLASMRAVKEQLIDTLSSAKQGMVGLELLLRELREKGIVGKAGQALDSATGAVGRIDPLATELQQTLAGAKELLDDATQTSQSVRARVDDLAAAQSELTAIARALADVSCELRDRELAKKITNVLSDTSLLAADIGILTENANSFLESGKPLVSNIGNVVSDAKQRAGGLSASISSLKEGFRAGAEAWRGSGKPEE